MKFKTFLSSIVLITSLQALFAETCTGICFGAIRDFINNTNSYIVATTGTLLLAVSVVGFFAGVVRFIWAQQQGEQKGIDNGKKLLVWGLVALFCAFSVFGILQFMQGTFFGKTSGFDPIIPRIKIAPDTGGSQGGGSNYQPVQTGNSNYQPVQTGNSNYVPVGQNGSRYTPVQNQQTVAKNSYDNCIARGGSPGGCLPVYVANGGNASDNLTNSGGVPDSKCNLLSFGMPCDNGSGTCKNSPIGGYECVPNSIKSPCDGLNVGDVCGENKTCQPGGYTTGSGVTLTCAEAPACEQGWHPTENGGCAVDRQPDTTTTDGSGYTDNCLELGTCTP